MKKFILILALLAGSCSAFAQSAVLHISFENSKAPSCFDWLPAELNSTFSIALTPEKTGEQTIKLSHPTFINLNCEDPGNPSKQTYFSYALYLSPGDDITMKVDFAKPEFGITVTGKGSNNNQPLMSLLHESEDLVVFYKDTLPGRVINALNTDQRKREADLQKYIALYKPSTDYIRVWKANMPYLNAFSYYHFKENNKYQIWDAYKRNRPKWQKATDSLFSVAKLNNDAAMETFDYPQLIGEFLFRENEWLLVLAEDEPQAFYKEWFDTDTATGKKLIAYDKHNALQEKIINKYFSGKAAEFLYAGLIENASTGLWENIPEIFERFKSKYPQSKYIPLLAPSVDAISAKRKLGLTDKMVFVTDNGTKLNTLEDVVASMKGKTVLVDMWGTWCGPCREEIDKHSARIREHFKGKNLDYLYIANQDLNHLEQWKKLIAYFNMEGTHIMANDSLTKDVMDKVKSQSFPTLFIIKRDGTIELSKTQSPIDEHILFSQLEAALKE